MIYYKNGTDVLHIATFFDDVVGGIRERSSGIGKRQSWVGIHKIFWFFNSLLGFNSPLLAALKRGVPLVRYPVACCGVIH